MKKILSIIALYVLWSVLDFLVHGKLLIEAYQATSTLWRPEEDMRFWAMSLANLLQISCFTLIYSCFVSDKSMGRALSYGALMGVLSAVGMGLGTWSYQPVTAQIALAWGATECLRYLLSGALVGTLIKNN